MTKQFPSGINKVFYLSPSKTASTVDLSRTLTDTHARQIHGMCWVFFLFFSFPLEKTQSQGGCSSLSTRFHQPRLCYIFDWLKTSAREINTGPQAFPVLRTNWPCPLCTSKLWNSQACQHCPYITSINNETGGH